MTDASYGWLITHDSIADEEYEAPSNCNARGMTGPRNVTDENEDRLKAAVKAGRDKNNDPGVLFFKMYDDDGELYYTGAWTGPIGSEEMFGPLDDFGTPNAGAVRIDYYDPSDGKWETL